MQGIHLSYDQVIAVTGIYKKKTHFHKEMYTQIFLAS